MTAQDITDEGLLKAWLQDRPQSGAIRIAKRVIPLWSGAMGEDWARNPDLTALPLLRQALTSGIVADSPTPEVITAASAYTSFSTTRSSSGDSAFAAIATLAFAFGASVSNPL